MQLQGEGFVLGEKAQSTPPGAWNSSGLRDPPSRVWKKGDILQGDRNQDLAALSKEFSLLKKPGGSN